MDKTRGGKIPLLFSLITKKKKKKTGESESPEK